MNQQIICGMYESSNPICSHDNELFIYKNLVLDSVWVLGWENTYLEHAQN